MGGCVGTDVSLSSDCIRSLPLSLFKTSPGNIVLKTPCVVWGATGRSFCNTPNGMPFVVGVPTKGSLIGVPAGIMGNTCIGDCTVGVRVETGVGWIMERVGVTLGLCKSILMRLSPSFGEFSEDISVEKYSGRRLFLRRLLPDCGSI